MACRRPLVIGILLLVALLVSPADGKRRSKRRRARGTVVTFQGFRGTNEGTQLYLLLNRQPTAQPRIESKGNTVKLILPGARTSRRFRFLDTRYFATPVRLIRTSRKRKNLIFTITLKEPVIPDLNVKNTKAGVMVALSFPPGDRTTAAPPRPRGTRAPASNEPLGSDENPNSLEAESDEAFTKCLELCDEKYPDRFDDKREQKSFEACSRICDE